MAVMQAHASDGYIEWDGHRTYYRIFGEQSSSKVPLLVLQGGPGSAHNYMLGFARLAGDRQVVFFDQLGGGLSDHPDDDSLWSIDVCVREVQAVREQLGLDEIHLVGHSWGGMLAIEYMLTEPQGVHSVTLASTMISMPLYQQEVELLKRDLPEDIYRTLIECEQAGKTDSDMYKQAYVEYKKRHIWRGGAFPSEYDDPEGTYGQSKYETMWGKSEAYADGTLCTWDRIQDLSRIKIPCLITSGQYDELTPNQAVITHDHIAHSRLRIFTAGSHCAHIEFEDEYMSVMTEFLRQVDGMH